MVYFQRKESDYMGPKLGSDGLVPRDQVDYGDLNEEAIVAIRKLAGSMVRYERSTKWHARLLRWMGFEAIHIIGIKIRIANVFDAIKRAVNYVCSAIDRLISNF